MGVVAIQPDDLPFILIALVANTEISHAVLKKLYLQFLTLSADSQCNLYS